MNACPACGHETLYCIGNRSSKYRTRRVGRGVFRWYRCSACGHRVSTLEFPILSQRDAEAAEVLSEPS